MDKVMLRDLTLRIHGKWYIHLHEWLIFMVNVVKYASPMDPMGNMIKSTKLQAVCKLFEGWVPCRLEPFKIGPKKTA